MDFYKTDPRYKDNFLMIKSMIGFPDSFPNIREFFVIGEKIFVLTYSGKPGKEELIVFDNTGKFQKTVNLPLQAANAHELYPFNFSGDKVYQLLENEENEEWELHAFPVK